MSEARLAPVPSATRWQVAPIGTERAAPPTTTDDDQATPTTSLALATGLALAPGGDLAPRVLRPADKAHPFTWVGAHGGAGATSLSRGSGTGADLTQLWPDPRLAWPAAAAVVFRSNAAGLDAASHLASQAVSGALRDVELVALVMVADSPAPPPGSVRRRLRVISRLAPMFVEVPWVEDWREAPYTPHRLAVLASERILHAVAASRAARPAD